MRSSFFFRVLLHLYEKLNADVKKIDMRHAEGHSSPFLDLLRSNRTAEVGATICAWSDLLGFAKPFIDSGWSPNEAQWRALTARIDRAYRLHLQNLSPNEFILLLNDGAVRTMMLDQMSSRIGLMAFWMRHVVKAHFEVNDSEHQLGLPGARTVVAVGVRASYTFPEVKLQDLFYHATRRDNPAFRAGPYSTLLVANPDPLQLNTAFSKAYLLDNYGSAKGISGSGLFVEASVLHALKSWSADIPRLEFIDERRGDYWFYGVQDSSARPGGRSGLIGFLCEQPPIEVSEVLLSTNVHRVIRYFTDDEDWHEFSFDLT